MASQPPVSANPRFSFGSTVTDMFNAIGRNWLVMIGFALLFSGIPGAVFSGVFLNSLTYFSESAAQAGDEWFRIFGFMLLIGFAVTFVFGVFGQTAITAVALRSFAGERPGFGAALGAGFRHFLRVFAIMIIYYVIVILIVALPFVLLAAIGSTAGDGPEAVGAVFGLMALAMLVIIPLLLLMTVVWLAAIPAAIEERLGPFAALGRSRRLTSGHRWKLLAMVLIYFVLLMILSGMLNAVAMSGMTMDPTTPPDRIFSQMTPMLVIQSLLGALTLVVTHPAVAATYANLRRAKEGVYTGTVADIFE